MGQKKPTVTVIQMPQAGNTMEEGTILQWLVSEGDEVQVGDVIFEVETDKAAVEVEAVAGGRLARIVAAEGDTVAVLEPVAYLADSDEELDAYLAGAKEEARIEQADKQEPAAAQVSAGEDDVVPASRSERPTGRVKASPAARKLAAERGIALETLGPGSGPGGRIVVEDVPEFSASGVTGKSQVMSSMRRAIALGLQRSKQTIPHFYIERTIDAEALMGFCKRKKAEHRCSINDVIVCACGRAVGEFAAFRSRVVGERIVEGERSNIGVAVQTEAGLMVPVVKDVDKLTLREVSEETRRVVEAARNGKLIGAGEGVFTVSNLGMLGVERFAAIINPPESAILAVGAVREEAVVREGTVQAGRRMSLTLSCDHRVIDGVLAAKFLNRLKELLETPEEWV